ncbi:MAG: hypothetical protein ACREIL_02165 [Nitrospiraceae bacterium]
MSDEDGSKCCHKSLRDERIQNSLDEGDQKILAGLRLAVRKDSQKASLE